MRNLWITLVLLIAIGGHAEAQTTLDHNTFTTSEQKVMNTIVQRAEDQWDDYNNKVSLSAGGLVTKDAALDVVEAAMLETERADWTGTIASITTFVVTYDGNVEIETVFFQNATISITWDTFSDEEKDVLTPLVDDALVAWLELAYHARKEARSLLKKRRALRHVTRVMRVFERSMAGFIAPAAIRAINVFTVTRDVGSGLVTAIRWEKP